MWITALVGHHPNQLASQLLQLLWMSMPLLQKPPEGLVSSHWLSSHRHSEKTHLDVSLFSLFHLLSALPPANQSPVLNQVLQRLLLFFVKRSGIEFIRVKRYLVNVLHCAVEEK